MAELQTHSKPQSVIPAEAEFPGRVVIENVQPEIDGGAFPIKRVIGEEVLVHADIHADSHDVLSAVLRFHSSDENDWSEIPMRPETNDAWTGKFAVDRMTSYAYTLQAWVDAFATWQKALSKKWNAKQDVLSELLEGAALITQASSRAAGKDAGRLSDLAGRMKSGAAAARVKLALSEETTSLLERYPDRARQSTYGRTLQVLVERERARFGSWYEMFPRSAGKDSARGATFKEAEGVLTDIAAMGFDVLYLPPIHPIGKSVRKGPNNTPSVRPEDPGSPWAIGSPEGGHKAIDPALGTFEDFQHFVEQAKTRKLEIALDLAFQCSPDHPYVREHPEWFHHRPDGTIRFAENPPKLYEDIYPLNFECAAWQALWSELLDVVLFWIDRGILIFRVDNPHTKPYRFWKWLFAEVRKSHPEVVFLAEAFTRPKIMAYLAKCGFSQSYSYFIWRTTKEELTDYFTELTQTPLQEFLRPNLFTNTPDVLHAFLQTGGRPAFQIRLFLAATLGASYGIYGPAFELCDGKALAGTEEYQDSEKYEIRVWDRNPPENIKDWIKRVNTIRKENPALHGNERLRFYAITNPSLLCYAKTTSDFSNVILVVVNLDPRQAQEGWVQLVLPELGLKPGQLYRTHDLLTDSRYEWREESNYVRLDPAVCPAHIFRIEPSR